MKAAAIVARTGLRASAVGCLGILAAVACTPSEAQSPSPRQPLPETRAREVIAQAVHEAGARPRGRYSIQVKGGRQLEVDVGVVDHKYGVAYVSGTERGKLGDAIPAHDVGSASLFILRDIQDRQNAVLLLHDLGYVADEQLGTDREKTGFAAELKLGRDVKDFLAKARGESWP
jgi:hypothetical protein